MDEIINKIIEAEHAARKIVEQAESSREHLDEEVAEALKKLRQEYIRRAEEKLRQLSEKENAETRREMEKLETESHEHTRAMHVAADKYHAEWVETFFASILHAR